MHSRNQEATDNNQGQFLFIAREENQSITVDFQAQGTFHFITKSFSELFTRYPELMSPIMQALIQTKLGQL